MTEKINQKLYNGDVEICFYPNSHRYKILEIKGKDKEEIKKLDKEKLSSTAVTGIIDKSAPLMIWAVRMYSAKVKELVGDSEKIFKSDLEYFLKEAEKHYKDKSKQACDVGSLVHSFCDIYSKEKISIEDFILRTEKEIELEEKDKIQIINGCTAFLKFVDKYKPVFRSTENFCYSIKNNHIGIYDVEFELLEEVVGKELAGIYVCDYKTSSSLYVEHELQVSAYLKAREEEGHKYKGACLLAMVKEDKEDKDGIVVKNAGDFEFKIVENVNEKYNIFLNCLNLARFIKINK